MLKRVDSYDQPMALSEAMKQAMKRAVERVAELEAEVRALKKELAKRAVTVTGNSVTSDDHPWFGVPEWSTITKESL